MVVRSGPKVCIDALIVRVVAPRCGGQHGSTSIPCWTSWHAALSTQVPACVNPSLPSLSACSPSPSSHCRTRVRHQPQRRRSPRPRAAATALMTRRDWASSVRSRSSTRSLRAGGSATVTVHECHGAAGDPSAACTVDTQTLTAPVTQVTQCNASTNGGGGTLRCSVDVTNNFVGVSGTTSAVTVNQCVGSGDDIANTCDPFPSTTSGATVTQCNGSANGGTLVELTCTATGTTSSGAGCRGRPVQRLHQRRRCPGHLLRCHAQHIRGGSDRIPVSAHRIRVSAAAPDQRTTIPSEMARPQAAASRQLRRQASHLKADLISRAPRGSCCSGSPSSGSGECFSPRVDESGDRVPRESFEARQWIPASVLLCLRRTRSRTPGHPARHAFNDIPRDVPYSFMSNMQFCRRTSAHTLFNRPS